MQGGFGLLFFSKDWIRRTSDLHAVVRIRTNRALEQLDISAEDAGRKHIEFDPKKAASKVIKDWEAQLMLLADGSMQEYHELKKSTVRDFINKFEEFCNKMMRHGRKGNSGT